MKPRFLGLILISVGLITFAQTHISSSAETVVAAPAAQAPGIQGPFVGSPPRVASFDGDVRRLPQVAGANTPRTPQEMPRPLRRPPSAQTPAQTAQPDPVVQRTMGNQRMPQPIKNFAGLDYSNWGTGYPPDPNGDVGPNHYIQTVNTSIGIFDKATGTRIAAYYYNTFFAPALAPCDNSNHGDPIVLYDAISGRWIITDFAWDNFFTGPFYECIAVSKSGDPVAGGWWLYTYQADPGLLNDYPKWGVWADGLYMSASMFTPGNVYTGVRVWAFNRTDLINGAVPVRNVFFDISPALAFSTFLPANLRGTTMPPTSSPEYFGSLVEPSTFQLWKFYVDWANTSNSSFTGPTNVPVASFTMPCFAAQAFDCVPQLGSSEAVDALGDRLMMQLQYRNLSGVESLWANHTVADGAARGFPTGVRWYEFRNLSTTPTVYQQGTYRPDSNYRWLGSLAVDGYGNLALGYSVSSSSMYPAIRYTGRMVTDALGLLPQGEASLIEGTGAQSGGYNRWGDYSAMTIDPADDVTFWYVNQYQLTTGANWQTRIGCFRLYTAPSPPIIVPPLGPFVYYFPQVYKSNGITCN